MAKGQKHANREIREPKQDKTPVKPESRFGSQINGAVGNGKAQGKG